MSLDVKQNCSLIQDRLASRTYYRAMACMHKDLDVCPEALNCYHEGNHKRSRHKSTWKRMNEDVCEKSWNELKLLAAYNINRKKTLLLLCKVKKLIVMTSSLSLTQTTGDCSFSKILNLCSYKRTTMKSNTKKNSIKKYSLQRRWNKIKKKEIQ